MNPQDTLTLLLIDDDELCARMVRRMLTSRGYNIHHANTGLSGLQLSRELNPHIILLDMDLPDLDGKVIANQLRSYTNNGKRSPAPIVAFTAESGARAQRIARAFGCDEFISKPIDTRMFPDLIANILKKAYPEGPKS